jgi:hypothetical protein
MESMVGRRKSCHMRPTSHPPSLPVLPDYYHSAHHLQDLLDQGIVRNYAAIARLSGLFRARLSQIMNLTLLAPVIQEEILFTTTRATVNKHAIRDALKNPVWDEQIDVLRQLEDNGLISASKIHKYT